MTHVKNAEAFARLLDFCTGYGGSYNPGRSTLRIEALQAKKGEVLGMLSQVINARVALSNAINQRQQEFNQLPRLVASILRTLEASGASEEKLTNARSFAQQIFGSAGRPREVAATSETTEPVSSRSTLQLAFASKADWFARLVNTVATEPLYLTNEAHLQVAALQSKLNELMMLNQNVSVARVQWSNALIHRNEVMYYHEQSLLRTAQAVKRYVRAIFGLDSEQYAQIKSLRFNKPSKK